MSEINKEFINRLRNNPFPPSNGRKRFRLVDTEGNVYSRYLGWQKLNGNVYGHQFEEREVSIVLDVLQEQGYSNTRTERDTIGTLFMFGANSPFSHPTKFLQLLLLTAVASLIMLVILYFNLPNLLFDYVSDKYYTQ